MSLAVAFEEMKKKFKSYIDKEVLSKLKPKDVRIYYTGIGMSQRVKSDNGSYWESLDFMDFDSIVDIITGGNLMRKIAVPEPAYYRSPKK